MKTDLINALAQTPETIFPAIVGQIESFAKPDNKDAAAIACGVLAYNINEHFLKPMSGLDISELILRSGQKNSTLISILLAGLEAISGSGGKMTIERPKNGEICPFINSFVVSGVGLKTVTADLNETPITFADQGDIWNYMLDAPLEPGEYSLKVAATFDDGAQGSAISIFTVDEVQNTFVPNSPKQNQTFPAGEIPIGASGTNLESVAFTTNGQTIELSRSRDIWTASITLTPGTYDADFLATFIGGDVMPAFITFEVMG